MTPRGRFLSKGITQAVYYAYHSIVLFLSLFCHYCVGHQTGVKEKKNIKDNNSRQCILCCKFQATYISFSIPCRSKDYYLLSDKFTP